MIDLSEIKSEAKPLKVRMGATEVVDGQSNIQAYRDAGFEEAAREIEKPLQEKIKLSLISSHGYLQLTKKDFQTWLDKLKFKDKDLRKLEFGPMTTDAFAGAASDNLMWEVRRIDERIDMLRRNAAESRMMFADFRQLDALQQELIRLQRMKADIERRVERERGPNIRTRNWQDEDTDPHNGDTIAERSLSIPDSWDSILLKLKECPIEQYKGIPPKEVLEKLKEPKEVGLFDTYVCIYPTKKKVVQDPLLCGKIKEKPDTFFYITEWGDDISIADLMQE